MLNWICSKCGNMQDVFNACKCGNTSKDKSSVFIYADEGIESLNLPIGSHTKVTIDGKSFEAKNDE